MNKQLLIVDDKKILRDSLKDYLEEKDFEFTEAESGEQALEIFKQKKFDLVILDEKLPGIDGLKTLKFMRNIDSVVPIIGLTGELTIEIREKYLAAGAYDIEAKSAIYEKLIPVIESALGGNKIDSLPTNGINFSEIAQRLVSDKRFEEAAMYLKEEGIEQMAMGNKDDANKYFEEAVQLYHRAGRTSKAKMVEKLIED
jgi:DNA-binding response OmpR family regulator